MIKAASQPCVHWQQEGAVGIITIDRPKALNALNMAVLEGLENVLIEQASTKRVKAVILTGAGDKAFVAGADIASMQTLTPVQAEQFAAYGQGVLNLLAQLPMPTIAAVNGFALGGGCELAMACDIILASKAARFGQPEVKLGLIPGFGGTQRLVRRVGMSLALDLCLTGRMMDSSEAVRSGLASRVVEGDVLAEAKKTALAIAKNGPQAVRWVKRAIHENADADLSSAQAAERSLFALCFSTKDQKEGMKAFLEKRNAAFRGQ